MKIAIIGSRGITALDLALYLPEGVTEIVSGGAKGVDMLAREYAIANEIKLTEFLPDYNRFGRAAPIKRNDEIIAYSDHVLAFWDGVSKGTAYVVKRCLALSVPISIIEINGIDKTR